LKSESREDAKIKDLSENYLTLLAFNTNVQPASKRLKDQQKMGEKWKKANCDWSPEVFPGLAVPKEREQRRKLEWKLRNPRKLTMEPGVSVFA